MATRFLVRGRVQGVGYRYFALREAQTLGVRGYVRNLVDGSVEVIAEAAPEIVSVFADRLAAGPAFGSVESVEPSDAPAPKTPGFSIR